MHFLIFLEENFSRLQKAKETLLDPELRKQYDQWRRCGIAMCFTEWKARKDTIHTVILFYIMLDFQTLNQNDQVLLYGYCRLNRTEGS